MRLVDFTRPFLEGRQRIVDATPSWLDLRPRLYLARAVAYERVVPGGGPTGPLGTDTLAFAVLGPDPTDHGDPDTVAALLDRLTPGGRAIVLLGWGPADLPDRRLAALLSGSADQILGLCEIDDGPTPVAVAVERVTAVASVADRTGAALVSPPTDRAERLAFEVGLANRVVIGSFIEDGLRLAAAPSEGALGEDRFDRERRRHQDKMDAAETNIRRLEATIRDIESSTSLEVGRLMVESARSPRGVARLPLDLIRAWRRR
jgi:hypothetical protein